MVIMEGAAGVTIRAVQDTAHTYFSRPAPGKARVITLIVCRE